MAAPKFTKAQRESHLLTVAQLIQQGYSNSQIAERTKVTAQSMSRDRRIVIGRWQREAAEFIGQQREVVLRQNEWILNEATAAWQTSKEERKRKTQRVTEGGDGSPRREASEVTEDSNGDPRFLQVAESALKTKMTLLGLEAPQEINVEHTSSSDARDPVGLQETMALLEEIAAEGDTVPRSQSMSAGPVLPVAVRPTQNGRGEPMDSGSVPGGAEQP